MIGIRAGIREGGPEWIVLRFELRDYPTRAPTGTPWNRQTGLRLEAQLRPKGERASMAFRSDWEEGRALYTPYDRVALESHPQWAQTYPLHAWHPKRTLVFYLECVYELLNDSEYVGVV